MFFHVDMDAFYASVEQADNPSLKGRPVIVGGSSGKRGVVSACSYEARKRGVHSAMPAFRAHELCPEGIFLPVRMNRYREVSFKIMDIFDDFTPDKYQISIDEAFLNMKGTEKLFGSPVEAARKLKARVRELTGLGISVGIAPNRFLAKLASDFEKPDGLVEVKKGEELDFLDKIKLKDIWGLGVKTLENLNSYGIFTTKQLREMELPGLQRIAGNKGGLFLFNASRGIDTGIYTRRGKNKSISNEVTFGEDTKNEEIIRKTLLNLSEQIMFRLIEHEERGKTVFLKLRYSNFKTITVQETFTFPLRSSDELYSTALYLLKKKWAKGSPLRLIGIGISSVEKQEKSKQLGLFEDKDDIKQKMEEAVMNIKAKGAKITKASLLNTKNNSAI